MMENPEDTNSILSVGEFKTYLKSQVKVFYSGKKF